MRVDVTLLASLMLLTGSINTIATKIQDSVVIGQDPTTGRDVTFKHPLVQTAFMFMGEALCLFAFLIFSFFDGRINQGLSNRTPSWAPLQKVALVFTVPALCDAGATTLLNLGLYYTYASVFQMLRGTLVVFAGVLTILLLKRRLRSHNWFGIVFITAGAAIVGASSVVYDDDNGSGGGDTTLSTQGIAPNPMLGNVLVICAQLLNALQFIVEEKYLKQLRPPVMLAVGIEGIAGLALCVFAIPLVNTTIDDVASAVTSIATIPTLQWTTLLTVASIAAFNCCGVSVTKRLSGASRAAIDACRTCVVWLFCLRAGWEHFHMLQVIGFAVLITGTSVYNDILRSVLPRIEQESNDDGDDGEEEEEERLLLWMGGNEGSEEESTDVMNGTESDTESEIDDGYGKFKKEGGVDRQNNATTRRSLPPMPSSSIPPSSRQNSSYSNKTRSIRVPKGGQPISMARSISMLPHVLSPHSLGGSLPATELLHSSSEAD